MIKNPYANAGNTGNVNSSPGLGKSPGKGHGNPLQYSCLKNPMVKKSLAGYGPQGRKELDVTEHACTYLCVENLIKNTLAGVEHLRCSLILEYL